MVTAPHLIFAIPTGADDARDWVVWAAAILGGLVAIGAAIRTLCKQTARFLHRTLRDLLEPEFDKIGGRIDALTEQNAREHAQTTAQIIRLQADVKGHQEIIDAHIEEAKVAGAALQRLIVLADEHVSQIADKLTDPGLPTGPAGIKHGF